MTASGVHSYSSAHAEQIVNPDGCPLPAIGTAGRRVSSSHEAAPRTKKGKAQSWGQPAPSPAIPNVRQSLGFPIRRNVARCRAVSSRLCLTRPMSNLDGLRPVRSSAFKFFRAVERCNAPAGLNHVQQRSDRLADVSHAHRLSSALSLDTNQRIEKDPRIVPEHTGELPNVFGS